MENVHNGPDQHLAQFYPYDALSDHLEHLDCLDCCLAGLEELHQYHLAVLDTPEYIQEVHCILISIPVSECLVS